jgi:hypothetical protein
MARINTSLMSSPHYIGFDSGTTYPLDVLAAGPGRNPETCPRLVKCTADGNIVVKRLSDGASVTIDMVVGQEEDIQFTELTSATAEGSIYW